MPSAALPLCSTVVGSKRAAQLSRIVNAGTLLDEGLLEERRVSRLRQCEPGEFDPRGASRT
jgi:hypothetical protein